MYFDNKNINFKELIELSADQLEDGIVILDNQFRCLFHNRAALEIFGSRIHSMKVARHQSNDFIFYKEDGVTEFNSDDLPERIVLGGKKITNMQVFFTKDEDHSKKWLLLSGSPIIQDGECSGGIFIYKDKTEINAREFQEQISKEKLRIAIERRDELLRMLAHDLLNPIGSIRGIAEILKENEQIPKGDLELVDIILNAADGLIQLLNDTLEQAMYKSENNYLKERIHLHSFLTGQNKIFELLAKNKNIQFSIECSLDHYLEFGAYELSKILQNLITNAIKFTPENKNVFLRVKENSDFLIIEVIDEGVGMSDEVMLKILCSGTVDSKSGTDGEHGHGLGLHYVKNILKLNGGNFLISHNPKGGTIVTVSFRK
ncbi:PAS domain S-box protein [Bacteriovorax sp. BSW11_IV]|uniref:sensor histidine kinase n=1 Tax=Bacteriovorax sp. BSW11_IV TaxID=1353529 RepID=UPI000389F23D|nr:PAS domain-containing sensor histidine kinase [Bacteriovorax sp. BSW11_IV]EQC44583.1 PAS domain S-box protein [Bacteriovorax sp. BSW11_IV]